MVLRPGEWIRVSANIKLLSSPPKPVSVRFQGGFWVRRNTFHPYAGGQFIEAIIYTQTARRLLSSLCVYFLTTEATAKAVDFAQTPDERGSRTSGIRRESWRFKWTEPDLSGVGWLSHVLPLTLKLSHSPEDAAYPSPLG